MTPTPSAPNVVAAWRDSAEKLAEWALARVFVRTDRFGGYYRKGGKTNTVTRPTSASPEPFSRELLVRHFRAARTDDVIGAHALTKGKGGTGLWCGNDIDLHDSADCPVRNARYALHQFAKVAALGFRPLLVKWDTGGYHLWTLFNQPVAGPVLHAYGHWLTRDAAEFGYPATPETFPKQREVANVGNWLRVPGRHHTHNVFALVFDGKDWLEGRAAVEHVLSLAGDSPDLIPDAARPAERNGAVPKSMVLKVRADRPDVFEELNKRTTFDAVVGWHEERGHRVTRREQTRADLVRSGKDGAGQSFNVMLRDGLPVTYNFSTNAGLPAGVGMTPAQVRCFYETGSCDKASMHRFADVLRKEYGWDGGGEKTHTNGTTAHEPKSEDAPAGGAQLEVPSDLAPAVAPVTAGEKFKDTDLANAARFVAEHGSDVRYVADWKRWCVYDGCRWVIDQSGALAAGLAHQTIRKMAADAAAKIGEAARAKVEAVTKEEEEAADARDKAARGELAWAKKSQDAKRVGAMLDMARPYVHVAVGADVFDTHPHLLNCPNGTVDLRTGGVREHRRDDRLTKLCPTPFDPAAEAPNYRAFLDAIIPQPDVVEYVRRLSGYAATGEATDETLHLFHGEGSNGKGKLLGLWVEVLGDGEYAATVPAELVADSGGERHPTERVCLRGARLAACEETGDGEALNAKRVKNLTGGGRIVARGMHQNFYTFAPSHTLVLATNHLPAVKVSDHATWRRLRVVSFPHTFWTEADKKAKPEKEYRPDRKADAGLLDRLRAEAPGVLADMVANAVRFYAAGRRLNPPDVMVKTAADYRDSEDVIGRFLDTKTRRKDGQGGTRGGELYRAFQSWYRAEVEPDLMDCPRARTFYTRVANRYGESVKGGGYMVYAAELCDVKTPELRSCKAPATGGDDGEDVEG